MVRQFGSGSQLDLRQHQQSLAAASYLEAAVVELQYRSPHTALGHLQAAAKALDMSVSLEGQSVADVLL